MAVLHRKSVGDVELLEVDSDPSGVETAPAASLAFDSVLGTVYRNYDGSTGWYVLVDSGTGVAAHASSHQHGGTDEVATATPGANAIPKADGSGLLDSWISLASETTPGRAEKASLSEVNGGTDQVRFVTSYDLATRVKVIGDDAVITPATLTTTADDYNPTDFDIAALVRLSSSTTVNITGMQAPSVFTVKYFVNAGANIIKFLDEDSGSLAANRFSINADISMQANEGVIAIYDTISARWRVMGKHI